MDTKDYIEKIQRFFNNRNSSEIDCKVYPILNTLYVDNMDIHKIEFIQDDGVIDETGKHYQFNTLPLNILSYIPAYLRGVEEQEEIKNKAFSESINIHLKVLEDEVEKVRKKHEKRLKPVIETMALGLGFNCSNNQHSFNVSEEYLDNKAYNTLNDFLNKLEDDYRIYFYFRVKDKKITWYS